MKHLYLLCAMILLITGGMAKDNKRLSPPPDDIPDIYNVTTYSALSVSGRVTDEMGTPFPGVNVIVKGTATGATTDSDGRYKIEVPDENSTLVFSFVGYTVQEVSV